MSPNRSSYVAVIVLALAAAAAVPVHAQPRLDERISLELEDAGAQEVLASFGQVLGVEAQVDPAIQGTISIEVHNVRVETALDAVCESLGCRWRLDAKRLRITADPDHPPPNRQTAAPAAAPVTGLDEPIDMDLAGAKLREVLTAFGTIAGGLPVIFDDDVDGDARVTVQLHDTPARQALDVVCEMNGCAWEVVETANGAVLHIRGR